MTHAQLIMALDWFFDFELKCHHQFTHQKLYMIHDTEFILWFWVEMLKKIRGIWSWPMNNRPWLLFDFIIWVEMLSSVDSSTFDLDLVLFWDFKLKCLRKLVDLDLIWFYDYKFQCWGKLKMFKVDPQTVDLDSGLIQ